MENYDIKAIKKQLEKRLDEKRYEHSLGVAYTAAALAMKYHCDMEQAYTAGLLHDCAKYLNEKESVELCEKYKVELTPIDREFPFLIHAKLGSVLAKEKYDINDPEILSAIQWHTTGRGNMSLLEKIIFSADYIEPGRKKIENLTSIRETIFDDLDRAVYLILANTIKHLEAKKQPIDEYSLKAIAFYEEVEKKTFNYGG